TVFYQWLRRHDPSTISGEELLSSLRSFTLNKGRSTPPQQEEPSDTSPEGNTEPIARPVRMPQLSGLAQRLFGKGVTFTRED
ncbi:hypothetical protein KIPB_012078, partial [Kipferlia bialata]